jgi:hypothetical protein
VPHSPPLTPNLVHLVQLPLPLHDNDGTPQPRANFADTRRELIDRFGGLAQEIGLL